MKMKVRRLALCLVLMVVTFSCSEEKIIYYEYEGVTITRVYSSSISYFYYGRCSGKNPKCSKNYILGTYSGFDGMMRGFLVFEGDSSVKMVKFESLRQVGNDSLLYLYDFEEPYLASIWYEKISGNYNNIIEVYSAINIEQERNKKNHSKVKAFYH
ncbi:hypothetical protein KIH41_17395 [Litoribacter ruber]|uniref:hypothetical protein n=1 Tax=Litoribacter ruber TaxID=702568 RepID=UPI001BDAAD14|nr:hypothetical protein [Litoribacter ruber]MBT0813067.1 hypothetical protein [Litoribacter ruber]